jgi:hypothetical protein
MTAPLLSIPVGVVVERHPASSPWLEALWRPVSAFAGSATAAPWTIIRSDGEVTTFYAGATAVELFRTETANYRSNLASGAPLLWVILRPTAEEPKMSLVAVTADPAEGEALTGAGNDLVDTVPMAQSLCERIRAFIAEHDVERPMFKRQRVR